MSDARLTPPPATNAVVQDAVETASVGSVQSQQPILPLPSTGSGPDPYQVAFTGLVQVAGQGNWRELVDRAEQIDSVTVGGDHQVSRLLVVVPLVVAYLIEDEIAPARFALERLPESLANHDVTSLLETLTQVTFNRSHSRVYTTVATIANISGRPSFFDQGLGSLLGRMLTQFVHAFRSRTLRLLSEAYSSLPVKLAQEYLGVSADAIINEAHTRGWKYDPATETLFPRASEIVVVPAFSVSSLSNLHSVANSVGNLDA